jgi:UDP-2,3-diacylglucosamine pyrophosphatase LpxH
MRLFAAVAPLVAVAAVGAVVATSRSGFPWWPAEVLGGVFVVLVVSVLIYLQALKRVASFYDAEIARGLTRALGSDRLLEESFELDTDRLIVFSDLHKGTRDGADDFWRSEPAYMAALAYYLELGHTLIVLGDVEELWENRADKVMSKYANVLAFERRYHDADRYMRVWGNHDDDWRRRRRVRRLNRVFGSDVALAEAIKLTVTRGGKAVGTLFLAHGHQGTADSQILATVSRPAVRIFGFLQRKFNRPWNIPTLDANLRHRHDLAMFHWATRHASDRLVLIAGHTHHPVFWSTRPDRPTEQDIAELEFMLDRLREDGAAPDVLAQTRARLEQFKARLLDGVKPPTPINPPCYFNTGCCAFSDGDVTGIEIAEGEIRLVRWPNDTGEALPKQLVEPVGLESVFDAVATGVIAMETA